MIHHQAYWQNTKSVAQHQMLSSVVELMGDEKWKCFLQIYFKNYIKKGKQNKDLFVTNDMYLLRWQILQAQKQQAKQTFHLYWI